MVALTEQQKREARPWARRALSIYEEDPRAVSREEIEQALQILDRKGQGQEEDEGMDVRGPDIYVSKGTSHHRRPLGNLAISTSHER